VLLTLPRLVICYGLEGGCVPINHVSLAYRVIDIHIDRPILLALLVANK